MPDVEWTLGRFHIVGGCCLWQIAVWQGEELPNLFFMLAFMLAGSVHRGDEFTGRNVDAFGGTRPRAIAEPTVWPHPVASFVSRPFVFANSASRGSDAVKKTMIRSAGTRCLMRTDTILTSWIV